MLKVLSDLSADEQKAVAAVEAKANALWTEIHNLEAKGSRELSLAKTKVEEAVLWVRQHLLGQQQTAAVVTPPTGTVTTDASAPTTK